jgi:hypothetical protein
MDVEQIQTARKKPVPKRCRFGIEARRGPVRA